MNIIRIKKGLNIPLKGEPDLVIEQKDAPAYVSINPTGFEGMQPKLLVKQGDKVLAGTALFFDKRDERIVIPSPVSGEIAEIIRGEKRVLLEVRIKNDNAYNTISFPEITAIPTNREDTLNLLVKSGLWSFFRQRPYDIIPSPDAVIRDIFISSFDSAPLAPDFGFILKDQGSQLQAGIDALAKLTDGKVYLGLNAAGRNNEVFEKLNKVEKHYFSGPHPAGNVGVQIHHVIPVNKGEIIVTLNIQDLAMIGKLMTERKIDASRTIAVTGPEIQNPHYIKTIIGSDLHGFISLKDNKKAVRLISGNVLTGDTIETGGCLGYYHHQLTVIPEGNYNEFIGWALPGSKKFSNTRLFLSNLFPPKQFQLDTNFHGSIRALVVTGQYEKVFPFDILPVYLIKAILTGDIDKMEELGIYEVVPEDFALCDVVCTSKLETQEIVRQGLELIRKEMS